MRRAAVTAAAVLPLTFGGCRSSLHAAHGGLLRPGPGRCKPGPPLAGVYLPFRLHVKYGCVLLAGHQRRDGQRARSRLRSTLQDDGDIYIRLRVDPAIVAC